MRLRHLPAITRRAEAYSQGISSFTVLHQFRSPFAGSQCEPWQWQVIDAVVQSHRQTLFGASVVSDQFSLHRFLGLTEREHTKLWLITFAEFARAAPLQVQRFFRAHELLLLPDLTVVGDRSGSDAPAGQRVWHLEGEAGFAIGAGQQLRLPSGCVNVFTTRTLQHFHSAFAAVGFARRTRTARQRDVITDERQAGAGAHVVAARVIEELVDGRRDFRLQRVNHFVDDADGQMRRHRFAGELRGEVNRDSVARQINLFVSADRHVDLRRDHFDPGVLETVLTALGIKHGEGQVRREVVFHRDARAVLGVAEFFQFQPITALGQQRSGFDLVAFQRQQGIADRLRKSNQRQRFIACLVLRFVEDDFHGAWHCFDAIAGDRMPGGTEHATVLVFQRQVVSAGTIEGQTEAIVRRREFAFARALVFQAHPAISARRHRFALLAAALVGVAERNLVADRAKALRRAQAEACGATVNQDFLSGLDPIRRAIAGKHGEHVAARFVGGRQVEGRVALAVGGQFGAGQFHRELPEVLQLVVDHRQLLGSQTQSEFGVGHRFAVRVQQHQTALHRFAGAVILFGQVQRNLEVRLDVLGYTESAAVGLILVVETNLVTARQRVVRQLEAALSAGLRIEFQIEVLQLGARRIQHRDADIRRPRQHRIPRILELTANDLQRYPITRAIQRPVGEGIEFGVVDFAVVVEVFRDEDAALFILADDERALRADVFQAQQTIGIGCAAAHHAEAISPQHIDLRHRAAFVFARGPDQQFIAGNLAHRDGVGDEHHGGRAVLADQRFDQIQTRLQVAQRDVNVARCDADEITGRPRQIHTFRWLNRLGLPQRIAKLADHRQTRNQRKLRLRVVRRRCGDGVAHLQFRHFLGDLFARLIRERALHHPTGFAVPVVPQVREGVGQAFAFELTITDHTVQVLLALEEIQRLVDAIHTNVGAAIRFHAESTVIAARRFEANHCLFITGETAVGEQEKAFTGDRRIAARLDGIFGIHRRKRQG